jgi:hypothetical protein
MLAPTVLPFLNGVTSGPTWTAPAKPGDQGYRLRM